jgi:serine/threonine protein kinase
MRGCRAENAYDPATRASNPHAGTSSKAAAVGARPSRRERDGFLQRACGGDRELEREARSLRAAHARADGFLSGSGDRGGRSVSDELSREPEALSRFAREAQTASALNHPNICTIYDIGKQDGRSFIVMECLEGTTLKDRLAGGPLRLDTVLDVGAQIGYP